MAQGVGYAIASEEAVQPQDSGIYHFNDEASWQALKRKSCINKSGMLFHGVDVMFNITNMLALDTALSMMPMVDRLV